MNFKGENNPNWKGGITHPKCEKCGKVVGHKRKLCRECWLQSVRKENAKCIICGKELGDPRSTFCKPHSKIEDLNGMWRGDDVQYGQLHAWVKSRFPKTDKCMICNDKPPIDLANLTGNYNRELENWGWLCRKCHAQFDGRLEKFLNSSRTLGYIKLGDGTWAKANDVLVPNDIPLKRQDKIFREPEEDDVA